MDMSLLQGAMSGLKAAADIAIGLNKLNTMAEVNAKAIELQQIILNIQSAALTAQSQQSAMADEIRDLKAEVARVEKWEEEKQRYALHKFPSGNLAFRLKPESANGEPAHCLCAKCLNQGKKMILQEGRSRDYGTVMTCHECKQTIFERERN